MFFSGTPVSFTNKTDRHDIAEILLKVALSTIKQLQINKQTWNETVFVLKQHFDVRIFQLVQKYTSVSTWSKVQALWFKFLMLYDKKVHQILIK